MINQEIFLEISLIQYKFWEEASAVSAKVLKILSNLKAESKLLSNI